MTPGRYRWITCALVCGLAAGGSSVDGQDLFPTEPISIGHGRVVVSSELSLAFAAEDKLWLNYTDYEQNALRHARLGATAAVILGQRVQVLSEVRTETGRPFQVYAMFARVRPWLERAMDIQVGRVPPTFGAYGRRNYGTANPLIGMPLPYQYLTSLRPDAVPATADDLLGMRGRGWRPSYPVGSQAIRPGVPLISALNWDVGVQVRVGDERVQVVMALTNGTLANPRTLDDNDGKQVAARLMIRPVVGLDLGLSVARGDFVSRDARQDIDHAGAESFAQSALGADVEYSRNHWIVRAEGLISFWSLPTIGSPLIPDPLQSWGVTTEGQYRLRPRLYVAGRVDHVGFSKITGTRFNGIPIPWDAPVTRVEVGGGYSVTRNVIAKLAYQHNWRDDRPSGRTRFLAAQLLYWF